MLAAQHDSEPMGGLSPTTSWEPGRIVTDRHGLLIPSDLEPGTYTLIVALYDPATGARLPVSEGDGSQNDHAVLGAVLIKR